MPRGKMLKTKVREAVIEASCVAEAIKLAEAKAEQKVHEKKSFFDSAREHIGKMIDRIDPIEFGAIGAVTVLIQPIVYTIPAFVSTYVTSVGRTLEGIKELSGAKTQAEGTKGALNLAGGLSGFLGWLPFLSDIVPELKQGSQALYNAADVTAIGQPAIGTVTFGGSPITSIPTTTQGFNFNLKSDVIMSYVIAFVIAYFLVRHGADVFKSLGGISGMVSLLLV